MIVYFSTEQELGLSDVPLLAPRDNKMMNRISSSIIRELSSNMLIPYTRLKLLECVGQGIHIIRKEKCINVNSHSHLHTIGEFGVVYKAQHTEPEGDIGYKTSTVAVKTLKGRHNNFVLILMNNTYTTVILWRFINASIIIEIH